MKDIARSTGVSIATVSAVLRNKDVELCIKRETAENIRQVARELGYCRSDAALQMQSGKSKNIIQFLPEDIGDYFAVAAIKTSNAALEHGYTVREIFHNDDDREFETLVTQTLGQWPAAYFTWSSGNKFEILHRLAKKFTIPIITFDFDAEAAAASIMSDDTCGIHQAVEHLYSLGHRKIGHVTDTFNARYASARYAVYRRELTDFGLEYCEDWCYHEDSKSNYQGLIQYVEHLMRPNHRPTAIVCGSDYIALRLMMICPAYGLRIPDDVSLIGYGGLPLAEHCVPPLTTIIQPFDHFGKLALEILLKLFDRQQYPKLCLLPTQLKTARTTRSL